MWIVQLALRRTYTFVVAALLIAAVSTVAILRMSTDIFPEINIPVVSVVWQFTGMPADEIETLDVVPTDSGILLRMSLANGAADAFWERRRYLAGPSGCGLCGCCSDAIIRRRRCPDVSDRQARRGQRL